jgi:hypothetical protein
MSDKAGVTEEASKLDGTVALKENALGVLTAGPRCLGLRLV